MANVKTANQLFPHDCAIGDLRFSAYNPRSILFYCIECGGNVSIRAQRHEWPEVFGPSSLALTEKALDRVIDPDDEAAEIEARRARNRPVPLEDDEEA